MCSSKSPPPSSHGHSEKNQISAITNDSSGLLYTNAIFGLVMTLALTSVYSAALQLEKVYYDGFENEKFIYKVPYISSLKVPESFAFCTLTLVVLALYASRQRTLLQRSQLNMPMVPSYIPILGTALQFLTHTPWDLMESWHRTYGSIYSFKLLGKTCISIENPQYLKEILQSKIQNVKKDSNFSYKPFLPILGKGIVTSEGKSWMDQRRKISTALKVDVLELIPGATLGAVQRLMKKMDKCEEMQQTLDIAEELRHLTLQVISECFLSLEAEESDSTFATMYLPIVEEGNKRVWSPERSYMFFMPFFWRHLYGIRSKINQPPLFSVKRYEPPTMLGLKLGQLHGSKSSFLRRSLCFRRRGPLQSCDDAANHTNLLLVVVGTRPRQQQYYEYSTMRLMQPSMKANCMSTTTHIASSHSNSFNRTITSIQNNTSGCCSCYSTSSSNRTAATVVTTVSSSSASSSSSSSSGKLNSQQSAGATRKSSTAATTEQQKQQQQQQQQQPKENNQLPPLDVATIIQGPSLLTNTNVHRPSPSIFFLPGLRSLPFWTAPSHTTRRDDPSKVQIAYNDPTLTAIVQHLEANYKVIREEYMSAVMGRRMGTKTDLTAPPLEPDYDVNVKGGEHSSERLHAGTWDWHSYILNGVVQPKFQQACPNTAKILNDIQEHLFFDDGGRNSSSSSPSSSSLSSSSSANLDNHNPFGFAFFSTLHGKSYIKPHTGPMNLRLRIHLPLIVPKDVKPDAYSVKPVTKCGLRVGDQIRSWEEGRVIVLDDSYEHEVWNETEDVRVLLLVDVWHPDVRKVERERIGKMFGYAKSKGWIGGGGSGGEK